jgi:hypothetical protein
MHAAFARPTLPNVMLAACAGKATRYLAVVGDDVLFCLEDWAQEFNSGKQPGFAGGVICHVALICTVERSLCALESSRREPGGLIFFTGQKINWVQSNIDFQSKGDKG